LGNRLHITVAASGLGHVTRGVEAWANDLAEALHARGEFVTLCKGGGNVERTYEKVIPCFQRESGWTQALLKVLPRQLSWRIGFGSAYGIEQTTFACNLLSHLRRSRADILHVQDPLVALFMQRARRLGLIRTRTILAHGTEESPSFLSRIQYLQHLGLWHLEQAKEAGLWKPTWTVIPNFIDSEHFNQGHSNTLRTELSIPADALVVLSVAAITRHHKRIDYLIAEFARLRNASPDLPVWLVVAGGWESATDELVAEGTRLLGDRVRFLVRFPRPRMPELYRVADVFTLCSLFEMMPIALIEATASGLPCLINRHPILEWMTGEGGLPIDMAAPGALTDTLGALLGDRSRREKLGKAARIHCLANFSRDTVLGQILSYYQQVMGRTPASVTVESSHAR
jgi:1,2-diacylglycerol 3-alpha-glucosyltransferase